MDAVLELRQVVKRFAAHRAVDHVSLRLRRGCFYSLLGPSGCGKTTTLRLIAGFETATEGDILLDGRRVNEIPPHQRNVNTVFQSYALFPHLTVERNVAFGLIQRGEKKPLAKVSQALEMVQLSGKETRLPSQLSGGEKQRVALARALVLEPAVLLLDEPLAALDLQLRKSMRVELKRMQQRTGITFLFVTHDQEEALAMSDEMAIMNGGRVEQSGTPEQLYRAPRTRFVANFLGAMNWIGNRGVRPEAVRVACSGDSSRCAAQVTQSLFLGNCIHLLLRLDSGEQITAELPTRDGVRWKPGDTVHLDWSSADEMECPA